jgi:hypothetical protein
VVDVQHGHDLGAVVPAPRRTGDTTFLIHCRDIFTPVPKAVTPYRSEPLGLTRRFLRTCNALFSELKYRSLWIEKPVAPV